MAGQSSVVATLTSDALRVALERNATAVAKRPFVGQGTATTTVKVLEGTRCEITEGPWRLITDMTPKYGGNSAGPTPGTLGRAALGSCMASAYVMWASRMGVPIHGLTVEVEADYDVRGELGVGPVSPAYSEVRCVVTVESDAPERDVCEVLRVADEHAAYLQIFTQPVRVLRETWFSLPPADRGTVPADIG
ncbi:MAG: OsmC family protein [Candidatus Palauibacterales bacterium]|nr:OsmC family protein [Candidatus Palauibacterales bacterium]